jgi:hypothetical protein
MVHPAAAKETVLNHGMRQQEKQPSQNYDKQKSANPQPR